MHPAQEYLVHEIKLLVHDLISFLVFKVLGHLQTKFYKQRISVEIKVEVVKVDELVHAFRQFDHIFWDLLTG